jgi:hypothetical protein
MVSAKFENVANQCACKHLLFPPVTTPEGIFEVVVEVVDDHLDDGSALVAWSCGGLGEDADEKPFSHERRDENRWT